MKITTTQVTAEDALRAVADGKQVQMIWECDGKAHFSDFNEAVQKQMLIGKAWLIVEMDDDENAEEIASSQENIAESCENAADEDDVPETVVTDPDTTPITVEIPNSHKAERDRNHKADQETMVKLYKDGWSQKAIAEELGLSQSTVNYHLAKLSRKGKV